MIYSPPLGMKIRCQWFPFLLETRIVISNDGRGRALKFDHNNNPIPVMDGDQHVFRLVTGAVVNEAELMSHFDRS